MFPVIKITLSLHGNDFHASLYKRDYYSASENWHFLGSLSCPRMDDLIDSVLVAYGISYQSNDWWHKYSTTKQECVSINMIVEGCKYHFITTSRHKKLIKLVK